MKTQKGPGAARRVRRGRASLSVFDPDHVERVLDAMPERDVLLRAADRLQGLAHPTRLKALIALSTAELCVGDVAAVLALSLSATSTMLKQLRSLGYVSTRHAGKQTYYRATSKVPSAVLKVLLAHDEAQTPAA